MKALAVTHSTIATETDLYFGDGISLWRRTCRATAPAGSCLTGTLPRER